MQRDSCIPISLLRVFGRMVDNMGFLVLCFLFSYGITFLLQYYLNLSESSNLFIIVHLILGIIAYCIYIFGFLKRKKLSFGKGEIAIIFASLLLIFFYYVLDINRTYHSTIAYSAYSRYFKYLFSTFLPSILLGIECFNNKKLVNKILNSIIPFSYILTLSLLNIVIRKIGNASVVNDFNFNGLTYQAISYYFAYCFSLLIFITIFGKDLNVHKTYKTKKFLFFNIIMLALQVFGCISVGGRGGIVLLILTILMTYIAYIKRNNKKNGKTIWIIAGSILGLFIVSKLDLAQTGLNRFFALFSQNQDASRDGRFELWMTALESFKNAPIFGHGIGSVFSNVGFYSHNMFMDVLVEFGIVGFVIFSSFFVWIVIHILKSIKDNQKLFIFYIFVLGFTMLQFSGYFISEALFVFPVSYFLIGLFRNKKSISSSRIFRETI